MIQDPEHVLKYIDGKPRLIPIGQPNANLASDVIINEFGAFVSAHIKTGVEPEVALQACIDEYAETDEDRATVEKYFNQYTDGLRHKGLLYDSLQARSYYKAMNSYATYALKEDITYIKIADLYIKLICPQKLVPSEFKGFYASEPLSADLSKIQTVTLWDLTKSELAVDKVNCRKVLETFEVSAYEKEQEFFLLFHNAESIHEIRINAEADKIDIFSNDTSCATTSEELFNAMRIAFLVFAEKKNLFALHSASIVYKDRLWLFSAMSGIGKSTHANLWKDALNVKIFNGDVNLINFTDAGVPMVYGIPWCGTSETSTQGEYPLGGIILLKQAPEDYVEQMTREDKIASILHRLISPLWTETMLDMCLDFTEKLPESTFIARLYCTPNPSAMTVMKAEIDRN